ncbi:B-cell receptor CD22-like [Eucyclogobius newberryi]|uniref:B-cell receptor CD22-like n=1 Tax=Eucyclogobius newberryi TaxID=166745 RepID=UPI003B5AE69D
MRAHFTTGVSTSWAAMKGVPLGTICKAASWTGPGTFARFYSVDVAAPHPLGVVLQESPGPSQQYNQNVFLFTENPCPITFYTPAPVKEYRSITLTCSTPRSCDSYLEIESVPPSGLKTHQSSVSYTATAFFTASWKDDGKEFTCQTRGNKDHQLIKKTTVSVQYAPHETLAVISSTNVTEGHSVTLTCSAKGRPAPVFTWYKYNQRKPSHRGAIWKTDSAQIEHSGAYVCTAQNKHGTDRSKYVHIDVQYAPIVEVRVSPPQPPYKQDQSLTLSCAVIRSNPPPRSFSWYKNEQRLSWKQTHVKSLQPEDSGSYKCSAENTVTSAQSGPLHIDVQFAPTSLTLSMDTEVTEGQSLSITCRVDSSPVSTLTLSRTSQGSPVELLQNTEHNSLSFSVTVNSAHSGEYTCSAHNSVGSKSTKKSLTVKYRPQKVTVQADPGLMVQENTTLMLHCSAQSHPPVSSVTWSRGPTWQGPPVHTGPTFSVSSVSVNHSGLYRCTAHNQVGQATSPTAEVQVTFGPKQAVVLRAEEVQGPDGSRSVTLSCSSHSFPPVRLYTWYRRTEGRELKVSENINYTVLSTQPGVYYCTAKNNISESASEPVSLFQPGKSRP